jgi:hypothetical protein
MEISTMLMMRSLVISAEIGGVRTAYRAATASGRLVREALFK